MKTNMSHIICLFDGKNGILKGRKTDAQKSASVYIYIIRYLYNM